MDTLRVLICDDEPGIRHSIARALRTFKVTLPEVEGEVNFSVLEAGTGEAALQQIEIDPPELLLLDYKLPGLTGIDVLERLQQQNARTLTVMVTAYASLETAIRATKIGAFDFIAKPFTPSELKETVRKVAEHFIVQRQARKLAEEKQRVRFEFIRVLGHELKAPLAAIEGYLGILRDRTAGDQLSAYDHMVQRCLSRTEGMRKLIADLLDMTRIESGEKKREYTDVDVVAVARAAIDTVKPAVAQRGITVTLSADEPVHATADAGEIEIIFNNLLSNAVKYNRDGGSVKVEIDADGDDVVLRVADTGIGLTAAEASQLFRDFVRIKNDKTRNTTGSGLGLSLVKKLALVYDGDVSLSSTPDEGSTFTVRLRKHSPTRVNTSAPIPESPVLASGQ